MTNLDRLRLIARIIERIDMRCGAVDGPTTPTEKEITAAEIKEIYTLARGAEMLAANRNR